jgi:hypothetical protein
MSKVIFSCFAGRRRYLEILSGYIDILIERKIVDEVHMWDYTRDEEDAEWLRKRWPDSIFEVKDKSTYKEYYSYYTKERYPEDDTVLIKCDDDIVYIEIDEFQNFVENRRKHDASLMMTACVINNPICTMLLFEATNFRVKEPTLRFFSKDHAEYIHETFLDGKIEKPPKRFCFFDLNASNHKLNINFVAFLSKDFRILNTIGDNNDEDELNLFVINTSNPILLDGKFLVSHMAYKNQRDDGFEDSKFLERYEQLRNKISIDKKDE